MRFAKVISGKLPVNVRFELTADQLATTLLYKSLQEDSPEEYIYTASNQGLIEATMSLLHLGGTDDYVHQQRSVEGRKDLFELCLNRVKKLFPGVS